MGVYAVGIPGTVIALFNAPSMREAKHYVHDQNGLADDLMVLESEGKAVWGGPKEAITLREATPIEYNQWQASRNRAIESGEHDPDREELVYLLYLISVRDPTSDDIYEELEKGSDPQ
jgi:hypothetical protein